MRENSRYHEAENHTGQDNSHTLVIEGRNAVLEAFRSGKPIDKVFVLDGCQDGTVRTIVREAKKHDALLNFVQKRDCRRFRRPESIRELWHMQQHMNIQRLMICLHLQRNGEKILLS